MKVWLTRHGQTRLNLEKRMQGRTDEPLNETGRAQARAAREKIREHCGGVHFDAVYASPLQRAVETASIISGRPMDEIVRDDRIIEADFGKYEQQKYGCLGPAMTLYWLWPEVIPAPESVEPVRDMIARSRSFLADLAQQPYENVLIVCHGGIMRVLSGCLAGRKNGLMWRPKPRNCEVRVFEEDGGRREMLQRIY